MLEKRFAALSRALGNPSAAAATPPPDPVDERSPTGYLVVRASGATATRLAIETAIGGNQSESEPRQLQLLMRTPLPRYLPPAGASIDLADCALRAHPGDPAATVGTRQGSVLLTVSTAKLSIGYPQLRPLLFQPVPVPRPLQALFASSVAHVLVVADTLDPHGLRPYLIGLAELVLRSALRSELDRVDAIATRRRAAADYIRANLADPALSAERIADALYISRRRLYQLFDDGDGVSGRIRQLRVEAAKELLGDPAHAAKGIGEVSKECGFANAAHFSRTFRKVVGQTPRDYRDSVLGTAAG